MNAPRTNGLLGAGAFALTAAYPVAVYFLMERGSVRLAGLALAVVLAVQYLAPGTRPVRGLAVLTAGALFAVAVALTNSETLARLYPVATSAAMLLVFGFTLVRPPSMIERIAVATGAVLDPAGVRYTRRLTVVWCGFFVLNGAVALATVLFASRETWALYNGLVSYLLAGALLVGERLFRPMFQALAGQPGA